MRGSINAIIKDALWLRVISLSVVLFFVLLADAILSFWVPNFMEEGFKSAFAMGLIMSFSSLVGFVADLVFPQVIKGVTVKKLIFLGILVSLIFILLLLFSTYKLFLVTMLLAMAVWGVYYEFLGFAQQQFVADSTPLRLHSSVWGLLHVFKSLAYFLGPIIAGSAFINGTQMPLFLALVLLGIGFFALLISAKGHERPIEVNMHEVNIWREIGHWRALFVHVWPVVLISLYLGLIDATFWTTGAVWTEALSLVHPWGGYVLSAFILPSIFMGFLVARMGIYEGKKKLAELFLLLTGLVLAGLWFTTSIPLILLIVFSAGLMSAISFPLVDGVYSDIVSRMGRERRHLIGLSRSTISLAYIVGPAVAGYVASKFGSGETLSVVGVGGVILAIFLLILTPKKLKLPQNELKTWE
jgi:MFS family permease